MAEPFALYRRNGLSVLTDMKIKIPFLLFVTAAFALARETKIPILVFSIKEPGAICAVLKGAGRATLVTP